jgi:beta-galactosidase
MNANPCSFDRTWKLNIGASLKVGCWVLESLLLLAFFPSFAANSPRQVISFDPDWLFTLANPTNAESPDLDDHDWPHVDVPHDWSIEGPFSETNSTGGAGGFLPAGVGWYRKHFTLATNDVGRRFLIEFDGVMANSDVWLNGAQLGRRPYGYVSFQYELTDYLLFGPDKTNVLAVRADNSPQPASRWYPGAGIYRHVRMIVTDPVHVEHWGTFVTTPQVSSNSATIHVRATIVNQSSTPREVTPNYTIISPAGKAVQTASGSRGKVPANDFETFTGDITIAKPTLWDLEHPNLYQLSISISPSGSGSAALDQANVSFGIRDAHFEPDTGFWLNGENLKIKGVCLHHDGGAVGAAVPLAIWERRFQRLKEVGCNAIRTAHNPPAPEFLDLCDRLGFLVMDETFDCWTVGKNRSDYHLYFKEWSKVDTRDMVLRDRNHPSVIVYSAGNEIHDTPRAEMAKQILTGLVEVFHQHDPSRPVSQALFRPNVSHDYDNGLADLLDVVGQNYRENEILAAHEAKPSRKILGTENTHDRKAWLALRDDPPYAGQFLWTGIDYLGESRRWPVIGSGSGLLDRTGNPKPRAFERQSWWSDKPMVFIARRLEPDRASPSDPGFETISRRQFQFSDWTPRNRELHEEQVEIYSNCDQVELLLNGKSLGSKSLPTDASPRTWKVPFEPGTIKAIGKNHGKTVATHQLQTAAKPARILLNADCKKLAPNWDDAAQVEVSIVDQNGILVPDASDLVTLSISGPGRIIAVDNGDNSSHEPFQAASRHAYQGRCLAIVKATATSGKIALAASAPGLASTSVTINAARETTK